MSMTARLPALWRGLFFPLLLLLSGYITRAQIIPDSITIVRDKWGVPHIYAATDEAVAYGLAWAAAEDDFATIQESFLSTKGKLSEVKGKEGAIMDVIVHLIGADKLVESGYDTCFSSKFKKVLNGYAAGINSYAAKHPREVLLKGVFPITGKDIIKGYVMPFTFITSVHFAFGRIFKGQLKDYETKPPGGSNAFAISKNKTTDGKTYLAINSHQPLEGAFAWYEAHLVSDEGLNILGSNFPGGVTLFSGVNEHLGWAHTLNYPDFTDIYKLTMHPKEKYKYRFDGKWEMLEERKIKLRVKMGFIKIPVTKKFYWSKYGATIKNKDGFYSIRFPANMDIRGAEQWYWMNKAQNFKEFKQALEMQALPGTNIIYADRDDNIFYISNGQFPYRNPHYDWTKVLPGDTSATLWDAEYYPLDSLPQLLNPSCGYVFNTNNTPFNATCEDGNLNANNYNRTMGFQTKDNNRSLRFQHLISQYDKLSYQDLKKIKYDLSFTNPVYSPFLGDIEQIMHLDAAKYPGIKETIELIKHWDRRADKESTAASTFSLAVHYVFKKLLDEGRLPGINTVSEQTFADALEYAQKHLKKHFGTIHVPLGELQLHVRGDKEYPMAGLPDVLAAMHVEPYKKGRLKTLMGESYIQLVRFSENGVELETVNAYGASNRKESPHYTDQMELFVNQKLKKMTLDKVTIFKEAESIYHPE